VSAIKIYVEGGGSTADGKAHLRRGLRELFRDFHDAASRRGVRLDFIPSGSRGATYEAFLHATKAETCDEPFLLVDSEGQVTVDEPAHHLQEQDGWQFPKGRSASVFLMAQVMESWIVADPDALVQFYGQHLATKALPKNIHLETVAKKDIEDSLKAATSRTQKGTYHKIRHAAPLLGMLSLDRIRHRCPHCDRFASALERTIASQ
jgi:hypothetical protein